MKVDHIALAFAAFFITLAAYGGQPADSPPTGDRPGRLGIRPDDPTPPLWLPIPKPSSDSKEKSTPPPANVYQMVWLPECQQEIGLSAEQKKALLEMNGRRSAESSDYYKQNAALPPEQQKAKASEIKQWRQDFESGIRKEIERVLTPDQLRSLKEYSFPQQAVALLQRPKTRQAIGFTQEQEESLSRLRKERWRRIQLENMKMAEKVWNLLDSEQQNKMSEVVKHQGPTSAVLSIAWELGFDFDGLIASYPMLAVAPARERLKLTAEQDEQLRAVMADATKRIKAQLERLPGEALRPTSESGSEAEEKKRVEAILTPQQLKTIEELDFRRKVFLALGYPEKRKTIHMTEQQEADFQRLIKSEEMQESLHRMDQKTSGQALKILTARQREQLHGELDKLGW